MKYILVVVVQMFICSITAQEPTNSFLPTPGETYVISGWLKDAGVTNAISYEGKVTLTQFVGAEPNYLVSITTISPSGPIIDGWQRFQKSVTINENISSFSLSLISQDNGDTYFDDIRFYPYNGNLKSFVYDPSTQRLMAELDENNYATFYEYDKEGGLVRVKKETERGVYTIQETRSGNSTLSDN